MPKMRVRRTQRRWRSLVAALTVGILVFSGFLVIAFAVRGDRPPQVRPVAVLSGEWEPFVGSNLPNGGPVAEIMADILQQVGFNAYLDFASWGAVDQRTAEGSVFGGFPLVASANRAARMLVSEPLLSFEYILFIRSDDDLPTSGDDLAKLRVGGIAGYDYWDELSAVAGEIQRFDTTGDGFEALARGEIDVFAESRTSGFVALRAPDLHLDAAMFIEVPSEDPWARSTQSLHFMMPKGPVSRDVLDRINTVIAEVKKTPEYRQMLRAIEPDSSQDTVVVKDGGAGLVPLRNPEGSNAGFTLPGTNGIVLEWPEGMDGAGKVDPEARAMVKLLDGPNAGRIVTIAVDMLAIAQ